MIDINLLPYRQETGRGSQLFIILLLCVLIAWSAFLAWTWYATSQQYQTIQKQEQKLDARVNSRVENNQQGTVVSQADTSKLIKGKTELYPIIISLKQALPKGSSVTDFKYQSGAITLQGTFTTLGAVSGYLKTLQGDPHFSQVKLTQMANLDETGKAHQFGAEFTMVYHKIGGKD